MKLGQSQELFMELLPLLLIRATQQGYKMRCGDLFRDPRAHGDQGETGPYGRRTSAHKNKLAVDINLFKNGEYLSKTADHYELGKYWKNLHPLCRWGGDFDDGNHYSIEHNGIY